ncbi:uncharacterized protein B0I36DRAFT_353447 [Microdochium trichocladiopsis]|uniref:Uncharacterized protein n=1 Tax=Microdochium trichocladiopsis TaxID=1682393 RepID=A0A9P8XY74_9PEZI|nr:uncharacterized protein B0I36DRAFT_353447 [Microdochium trichocladiopsis]KAH7020694.1 hypothetical protein B0I36DRAFT_353447 [Microdochium trichocladiopsis]
MPSSSTSTRTMITSLLALAAALTTTSALGCYSSDEGPSWDNINWDLGYPQFPAIANKICSGPSVDYYTGEKRDGCFNSNNGHYCPGARSSPLASLGGVSGEVHSGPWPE